MSGPSLMGLVASLAAVGHRQDADPQARAAPRPLPDGGAGLVVSEAEKRREVRRFLAG